MYINAFYTTLFIIKTFKCIVYLVVLSETSEIMSPATILMWHNDKLFLGIYSLTGNKDATTRNPRSIF